MRLTRDFRETVWTNARRDRKFRQALFSEALDALLAGDAATDKAILRDYVNATLGLHSAYTKNAPRTAIT